MQMIPMQSPYWAFGETLSSASARKLREQIMLRKRGPQATEVLDEVAILNAVLTAKAAGSVSRNTSVSAVDCSFDLLSF